MFYDDLPHMLHGARIYIYMTGWFLGHMRLIFHRWSIWVWRWLAECRWGWTRPRCLPGVVLLTTMGEHNFLMCSSLDLSLSALLLTRRRVPGCKWFLQLSSAYGPWLGVLTACKLDYTFQEWGVMSSNLEILLPKEPETYSYESVYHIGH